MTIKFTINIGRFSLAHKALPRNDAVDRREDLGFLARGALDELGAPGLDLGNVVGVLEVAAIDAGVQNGTEDRRAKAHGAHPCVGDAVGVAIAGHGCRQIKAVVGHLRHLHRNVDGVARGALWLAKAELNDGTHLGGGGQADEEIQKAHFYAARRPLALVIALQSCPRGMNSSTSMLAH